MEPLALIISALAAGAAASAQDVAAEAIKDAYHGLKDLIRRRFAGKPEAEMALDQYEKKPDVWKEPLKDTLKEAAADEDSEIITAAQKVMALLHPEEAQAGRFNLEVHGNMYGVTVGDHNTVTATFGGPLPPIPPGDPS